MTYYIHRRPVFATSTRYLGESEMQSTRMEYVPPSFSEITISFAVASLQKTRYYVYHDARIQRQGHTE